MPKVSLVKVPLAALERELQRRREELPKLIAQRDALNRRIAEIEGLEAAQPAAPAAKRAARGKARGRRLTLKDALAQALANKEGVHVTDALEAIRALGYKSRSKNLMPVVRQALYYGERFQRVGRGLFALKA